MPRVKTKPTQRNDGAASTSRSPDSGIDLIAIDDDTVDLTDDLPFDLRAQPYEFRPKFKKRKASGYKVKFDETFDAFLKESRFYLPVLGKCSNRSTVMRNSMPNLLELYRSFYS